MDEVKARFNCKNLNNNKLKTIIKSGSMVSIVHHKGDPQDVNRIIASVNGFKVEVLPSKGFSIGQVFIDGQPKLWNPPIDICDPEDLDLFSDEIAINGNPAPGFTFLKTFSGGIEFYGLRNWGMPFYDEQTNFHHPLHGETSNIPVDYCDIKISDEEIILSASFVYRDLNDKDTETWYLRGSELFEVKRSVIINKDKSQIQLIDRVKNISKGVIKPDWGYHITFLPANGSRLIVPSASVENRSGENVPEDFERWSSGKNNKLREETGIIHKGLKDFPTENGRLSYALVIHPDNTGIKVSFPVSPYFQTWFCKGGAYTEEFTRVSDGKPLFEKNWDGIGIEFGSSALDHNGNTDQSIPEQALLQPGSSINIPLSIDFVKGNELLLLSDKILIIYVNRLFVHKL